MYDGSKLERSSCRSRQRHPGNQIRAIQKSLYTVDAGKDGVIMEIYSQGGNQHDIDKAVVRNAHALKASFLSFLKTGLYKNKMSAKSPPPYTPEIANTNQGQFSKRENVPRAITTNSIPESQLAALKGYDMVYLIDDSTSMTWLEKISGIVPWPSARDALVSFSNLCCEWDDDGQDLYFINRDQAYLGCSPEEIAQAFDSQSPYGSTNMGRRLQQIACEYFKDFDPVKTKPVNVIAITDGEFTDDVESVVRWIVRNLENNNVLANSFGIQFVQIGADKKAKKYLEYLDDKLSDLPRDIVDTVPWIESKVDGRGFDGKYLLKAVCGAINKKLDNNDLNLRKGKSTESTKKPGRLRRFFGKG